MQLERLELCREIKEIFWKKKESLFLDKEYLYRLGVYHKSHRILYVVLK